MNFADNKMRNKILAVLFIGVLMGALDIAIVGPAMPAIQAYFKVGDRLLAWIFAIYVLFNLIGTPFMSKLSDLFGRRPIYILDVVLFAAGSLLVAVSPSFTLVLVGRAVQGFGAGGIFPVASAVIGDTFPPEKRGSALGLIGAVFGLAFIIGPILGGVLLMISWHWLFIVNLPIAALVIVLSLRILPAARPEKLAGFDWQGMLAVGLALAALALGINQIDTGNFLASLASAGVWPFLLAAVGLAALAIRIEGRATSSILDLSLFRRRQMVLAYVLSAGAGLGEAGLVFLPALAVAALGVTSSQSSFLLVPLVLAIAVASPVVGFMLDRFGSKVVILAGTSLLAIGMFLLSNFMNRLAFFLFAAALVGLGLSALLGAPLRYIMLNESSPKERSVAQGIVTLFGSIGQLVGSAMVGAVAASQGGGAGGYENAYFFTGVVALLLVISSLGLKARAAELETVRKNETRAAAQKPGVPRSEKSPGGQEV